MTRAIIIVVLVLVAAPAEPARAHHGYNDFDRNQVVTVEGMIKRIAFVNPHVMLTLTTSDSQTYTVEWASVYHLSTYYGITHSTLIVGDTITLTGNPKRKDRHFLSLLTEIRRPADRWIWSQGVFPPGANIGR